MLSIKNILRNNLFVLFFFSATILLLYSNTFHSPFTFDDAQILDNYFIAQDNPTWESLKLVPAMSPNKARILPNLTFALNYYFGGSSVWGYHLVNIIIHIAVTFVFFLLAKTTLSLPGMGNRFKQSGEIAFAAALLWAVHPLQTNAVTYIVQRMTSMATLFFLLSLLCYIRARVTEYGNRKIPLFAAAALLGVMALFSKENSGMLPIMILGCELFLLSRPGQKRKNPKIMLVITGGALVVFLLICWFFLGNDPLHHFLGGGYGGREFTLGQRLLTETRIIFHYLSLLVLPLPGRLNLAYDYQLSTGLLAPPATLLSIIGIFSLTTLIFFLYKKDRLTAFAIFWFLGNLAVESSFIPLELIFEHRMYLPSMFIILAGTAWVYRLQAHRQKVVRFATVGIMLLLAIFTWQRNGVWENSITLWSDVIQKSPGSIRGHVNLGIAYSHADQLDKAEALLLKSIALDPADGYTHLNLGGILIKQERYPEAITAYKKAIGLRNTNHTTLNYNLAFAYQKNRDYTTSIEYAKKALSGNPYHYNSYIVLGTAYFKTGAYIQAEDILKKALNLFPDKGDIYVSLGAVYEHQNKLQQALALLNTALTKKDLEKAPAYNTLGIIHWRLGNYPESIRAAEEAIRLDPELLDAYLTLGITYEDLGRQDLAFKEFRNAWQKGHDMVNTYNYWAKNFMGQNNIDRAILYLQEAIKLEPNNLESQELLREAYRKKGLQ